MLLVDNHKIYPLAPIARIIRKGLYYPHWGNRWTNPTRHTICGLYPSPTLLSSSAHSALRHRHARHCDPCYCGARDTAKRALEPSGCLGPYHGGNHRNMCALRAYNRNSVLSSLHLPSLSLAMIIGSQALLIPMGAPFNGRRSCS